MKKYYLKPLLAGLCMLGVLIVAAQVFNNFGGGFKPFPVKDPYKQMWAEVDSLENAGLTESANKVVKRVMDLADREKNSVQKIKAFMYMAKFRETLEEDAFPATIEQLDEMISHSSGSVQQLLYSIKGEVIWQYYKSNMWAVNQRTPIVDDNEPDLEKWDAKRFAREAMKCFEASLKNEKELQKVSMDDYKELLTGDSTYRSYRHTLYDFLMHRAIVFYSGSYLDMLEPAEKFELKDKKYFGLADGFTKISADPKDSLSSLLKAVQLYQALTVYHEKDADPSALVQLELERLAFIRAKSVHDDKTTLYIDAITKLAGKYNQADDAADINYALAQAYFQESNYWTAKTKDTYLREYRKKALEICNKTMAGYAGTEGANNCLLLKREITEETISISTEKATLPQSPVLVNVSYKNTDKIFVRVYKHDYDKIKSQLLNTEYEESYKASKTGTLVKTYTFNLKAADDHYDHTTEVAIDPLETGFYTISFSSLENDADTNSYNGFASIWSTHISVFNLTSYYSPTQEFKFVDRQNGELMKGAQVHVYRYKYNYATYAYEDEKIKTVKTGKDGRMAEDLPNDSYFLDIRKGKDRFVTEAFYTYSYNGTEQPVEEVRFFLDRGLYRPGQVVNFKLLAVKNTGEDFHIRPGKKISLTIYDINQREISKLEVSTNEFGTASGSFVLPAQCATGGWTLACDDGSAYFQVEEYKRPKFEVKIDSIPGSYAVNDVITVRGSAKALANFGVDNAKVTYRVDRLTQMRIYDWSYYNRYPSVGKTIATGNMKTDSKGEFEFSFTAIPDTKVDLIYDPFFTYTVTVDVTDLSGETRSVSYPVTVGYKTMQVGVYLPYYLDKADTGKYEFYATNLSGFEVHTTGNYEIKKLVVPEPYLLERTVAAPDEPVMTEAEFKARFPHIPYKDENDVEKWAKGNTVASGTFDTKTKTKLTKTVWSQLGQGWYAIITKAKDSKGNEVEQEYRFMVYDKKEKSHPFGQLMTVLPLKTGINKGESAEILLGSSAENIKVHIIHEYKGKVIKSEVMALNKEQKLYTLAVNAEQDLPYILHFAVVKDNHLFTTSQYIYTYDTTRNMELELVTFRDKMLPGATEDWKVKLTGNQKKNIAQAEVLATMYDASLDLMAYTAGWDYYFARSYNNYFYFGYNMFNLASSGYGYKKPFYDDKYYKYKTYEHLNYFGWYAGGYYYDYYYGGDDFNYRGSISQESELYATDGEGYTGRKNNESYTWNTVAEDKSVNFKAPVTDQAEVYNVTTMNGNMASAEATGGMPQQVKVRTNFSETAFFYPHLVTNENGEASFSFKVPESLTKWKFRALAITKDLRTAYLEKEMVTKKEVMITAFSPRFMREGDKIFYSAKVTNLTDADLNGNATIEIKDALTGKVISLVEASKVSVAFSLKAGESKKVEWYFQVPLSLQAITCTVKANAGTHTDGEEMTMPVLSNRILVTESVPLQVRGDSSKTFTLKNLVNTNSGSLTHERLTLEVTSNPAWYAIQALPYMMEYPYECAEQTFNRYYANVIGAHIANSDPRISKVFEIWKNYQPDALLSNLEKNQELKNILIEETPWLRDAKDETERKRRIGILFDLSRMKTETTAALEKLRNMQLPNGGFPWFAGGKDNRYITQYIISGLGHLRKLGIQADDDNELVNMLTDGVHYLDNQITNDYKDLVKYKTNLELYTVSTYQVQYLYARSYFKDIPVQEKDQKAYDYFFQQSAKYWTSQPMLTRGMIALVHHRSDKKEFAQGIVKSLKENSIRSDEMGMYWKQTSTWFWYEAPIENQALMIEVFDEVTNDQVAVEELKIWLLKNKQTNDWKTTKATADACYALLLKGTSLLSDEPEITITMGDKTINTSDPNIKKEAGTGYFKYTFDKADIKPAMGNITMAKKGKGISLGAVYWQYMENIDKVPASFNQLQVVKKLYRQKYTSTGTVLEAITDNMPLKIGERLVVRLELKVDRDMEFVHIKDMRASSLEPENVLSGYKYRERLSYYESTRDAATNFFVEFMPKGTYVFEYNLRVTHAGEFSNGLTTIQCMYAPEFTSHTAGMNIKTVEE